MVDRNMTLEEQNKVDRAISQACKRSWNAHRGFVDADDLRQEAWIFVYTHARKVGEWLDTGKDGERIMAHAIYQHLHNITMEQRYLKDGTRPEDYYAYSMPVLTELLPEIFDDEAYYGTSPSDLTTITRSGKSLAETGDRMAMVADIKAAYASLNEKEKLLVSMKYSFGGMTDNEIAQVTETPEATVNRHVKSALRKMARKISNEPVVKRKAMSNAQSQHVTKEQE